VTAPLLPVARRPQRPIPVTQQVNNGPHGAFRPHEDRTLEPRYDIILMGEDDE
jgi:hypothetical protein